MRGLERLQRALKSRSSGDYDASDLEHVLC